MEENKGVHGLWKVKNPSGMYLKWKVSLYVDLPGVQGNDNSGKLRRSAPLAYAADDWFISSLLFPYVCINFVLVHHYKLVWEHKPVVGKIVNKKQDIYMYINIFRYQKKKS